ncbi:MAG: cupin domain-containing protein [Pseudopedobacter saltans]|uniref:Cupin domain-containing protein n=1 Tax=Pseudopedobacter saltans TaxID=151895 RepID=A0A2W5GKG3_9SPHI|nr:MAG: cupin domain-containing protein [Pseudopedobacter saltans]
MRIVLTSLVCLLCLNSLAQKADIYAKGVKADNSHFTGNVWLNMILNSDSTYNTAIGKVHFEPNARTYWHKHPAGQILLVTEGTGWYQEKGKPIQIIQKGEVIKCTPNIEHWHGATPTTSMMHIAIGTNAAQNQVIWSNPVTEREYKMER